MSSLQLSDQQGLKVEQWLPGSEGTRKGESVFSGCRASVGEDENILKMAGGDGSATV